MRRIAMVDGKLNTGYWGGGTGDKLAVPTDGRFGLLSHQGTTVGSVIFDNLKMKQGRGRMRAAHLMILWLAAGVLSAFAGDEGIDPARKHAWAENAGWVNTGSTNYGAERLNMRIARWCGEAGDGADETNEDGERMR